MGTDGDDAGAVASDRLVAALPSPSLLIRRDGLLVAVSDTWRALLDEAGVRDEDQASWLPGARLTDALDELAQASGGGYADVAQRLRLLLAGDGPDRPVEFAVPFPGAARWFIVASSAVDDRLLLVAMTDITGRRAAEAQLAHQAAHDSLTGLPNRSVLVERLSRLGRSSRDGEAGQAGVFFLDLDDFKAVNDALGHAAGDAVLREVARRLTDAVRTEDLVVRLGGDEFVVVATRLTGELEALAYADRLLAALAPVVVVDGQPVSAQASIGIAMTSRGDGVSEALLRNADIAMLRAKAERTGHLVFNEVLDSARRSRADAVYDLRTGLREGQVRAWFQPVVDLASGRVVGAEALARWVRPSGTVLPPASFVPLAERTGLIGPLDRFILHEAAAAAAGPLRRLDWVSVNASPLQVASGLVVDEVREVLAATGLAPDRLTIEVTETAVLGDPEAAGRHLQELKDMGIRLALDDFGTGYSSLSHLAELPMDCVKLDRSFVRRVSESHRAREISRAVIALGASLGMSVVAEGVETEAQRDALARLGDPWLQGHLYGAAVPAARFAALHLRQPQRSGGGGG